MREIKFRGWERELQMMVYDTELGGWIFEYDGNPVRAVNQMINEEDYFYDLMQYTGLKDKNGVEIYEGDILDSPRWVVTYIDSSDGANLGMPIGWYEQRDGFESFRQLEVGDEKEVIGNIYEHPHLVSSKSKL